VNAGKYFWQDESSAAFHRLRGETRIWRGGQKGSNMMILGMVIVSIGGGKGFIVFMRVCSGDKWRHHGNNVCRRAEPRQLSAPLFSLVLTEKTSSYPLPNNNGTQRLSLVHIDIIARYVPTFPWSKYMMA
jgi:hypothetical protein